MSVFGSHKKFLVDNCGEFYNEDFHSLCENVNICILTIRRKPSSEVVANNIVMHTVTQAFIQSESSDRIKRALQYQTRTSGGVRYFTGDTVYYKREYNSQWHGPGTVIRQDGKQILVKLRKCLCPCSCM